MVEKAFLRKNTVVIKGKKCNPTNIFLKQKTKKQPEPKWQSGRKYLQQNYPQKNNS